MHGEMKTGETGGVRGGAAGPGGSEGRAWSGGSTLHLRIRHYYRPDESQEKVAGDRKLLTKYIKTKVSDYLRHGPIRSVCGMPR